MPKGQGHIWDSPTCQNVEKFVVVMLFATVSLQSIPVRRSVECTPQEYTHFTMYLKRVTTELKRQKCNRAKVATASAERSVREESKSGKLSLSQCFQTDRNRR